MSGLFCWLKSLSVGKLPSVENAQSQTIRRAQELIAAIDRGGIPLNPMIVNGIGRDMGISVLASDPMNLTIEKIRIKLKKK
jgi:hypothetical protein